MYSLLFLILFTGCYLLYITSKKARLGRTPPRLASFSQNGKRAKVIASLLLLIVWVILIGDQGFGSGTFAFGGYIMTALSVVVLLNPFQYLRWTHLLGLFIVAFLFETTIF